MLLGGWGSGLRPPLGWALGLAHALAGAVDRARHGRSAARAQTQRQCIAALAFM